MNERETDFFIKLGFKILKIIGRGSFGVIYYVHSMQYNMNFALKKIPISEFKEDEIECMNIIDSPRIVRLYQYFKFDQSIYLLMEYCPKDLMRATKKKLAPRILSHYIYEMLICLKICHDNGVAHNDIKPSNFLIDHYGHVKISDFGLAQIFKGNPATSKRGGSINFMAPELFEQKIYNPMLSDIWSLGVTIYFLASHRYPFEAPSDLDLIDEIQRGQFNLKVIHDEMLRELIARCIIIDPSQRATVDELLKLQYFNNNEMKQWDSQKQLATFAKNHNMIVRPKIEKPNNLVHKLHPVSQQRVAYAQL